MVNKPKAIGTAAETAVLKVVKPYFPDAHRLVLAGQQDQGDIRLSDRFILEVKGGRQTMQIGDKMLDKWLNEANVEAVHSGVDFGFLVTQRAGVGAPNAHRWWAWLTVGQLVTVMNGGNPMFATFGVATEPVRLELGVLLKILLGAGLAEGDGVAA